MEKNQKINNILQSLKQNKYTYLSVIDNNGEEQFKVKLDVEHENLMVVLDTIFDSGFTVKKISEEEF